MQSLIKLPPQHKAAIKLLHGHLSFGLHTYLPGDSTYFTFLRDPVERVISHYYFLRSHPDLFWIPEEIEQKALSFHEVLERDMIMDITNVQTRLLAGLPYLFPSDAYTDEHLETAKQNLQNHFLVGLTERFDESLLLLSRAFGWQNIYYKRRNVTSQRPHRQEMPAKTVDLIKRKNELDVALYAFAQELFAEQLAQQNRSFFIGLRLFQLLNRLRNSPLRRISPKFQRPSAPLITT